MNNIIRIGFLIDYDYVVRYTNIYTISELVKDKLKELESTNLGIKFDFKDIFDYEEEFGLKYTPEQAPDTLVDFYIDSTLSQGKVLNQIVISQWNGKNYEEFFNGTPKEYFEIIK